MSNNTDIYRLVEEMNKAKAKKEVNDIFSMLDEVQKENNISVDDIRNSVNRTDGVNLNSNYGHKAKIIKKPSLPNDAGEYDKLSDGIIAYISNVEYGDIIKFILIF